MINQTVVLNGGARSASELTKLTRRAMDAQLGLILNGRTAAPDPAADEAALVYGDYYALAAHHGSPAALNEDDRRKLAEQGRSEQHLRKLELLCRHNAGSQPLSDSHLELQLKELDVPFNPSRAASDRKTVLIAWAEAQHRAAAFNHPVVQAQTSPLAYLLDHGQEVSRADAQTASPSCRPVSSDLSQASDADASAKPDDPLLSEVIEEVVNRRIVSGRLSRGPKGTGADAERVMRQIMWMVGDFRVSCYDQQHLGRFEAKMMAMPKTVRVQSVWHETYDIARAKFPALTAQNTRHGRTMNKDLAYIAGFAESMIASGYWRKGQMCPLELSHSITASHKRDVSPPWQPQHLELMFKSPSYTGNDGSKRRFKKGPYLYQDAAYWVLVLAYWTGARQEELCGLLIADIVYGEGAIPHIVIRENELRGLKREASQRFMPIAPQVLDLGFLDYVDAVRADGGSPLFAELWINAGKRGGDQYRSIFWNKLMAWLEAQPDVQIPLGCTGEKANFKSVRSTFLSQLDRADINQNIVADLAGHARQGVTATTYQDLVASGGLDDALTERLAVLARLPNVTATIKRCAPALLPLQLRTR